MPGIGILAYGSLKEDPGTEIGPLIVQRIPTQTPFPVEYARYSRSRGGAPTVVPHPSGKPVSADILVLNCGVSLGQAKDLLWRREMRKGGTGQCYSAGNTPNSVLVKDLPRFLGLDHVLYTDFPSSGKIALPDPMQLAKAAVKSVPRALYGKDGISYLRSLANAGVYTELTAKYRDAILSLTKSGSLEEALSRLRTKSPYERCKAGLLALAGKTPDGDGYVDDPAENLLPGVRLDQFESDLRRGAGHELRMKFCAIHSSSALAVNTFAPFKDRPQDFLLGDVSGCDGLSFEAECDTGLRGTPPTLDVLIKRPGEVIGIESKFLEYFTPKKAEFSASYTSKALSWAENCWWQVKENAETAGKRNLDVAQLVKHYFGIAHLLHEGRFQTGTLCYLFWEPENATDIDVCRRHRGEICELASAVSGSRVVFKWLSYPELWRQWAAVPSLATHARNLRDRYAVQV